MLSEPTTGRMSRTTGNGPSGNQPDDGDCVVCGDPADGIDAPTRQPICRRCALIRTDGGDGKYNAVCSDCTFEELVDNRHRAARAVDAHRHVEPSHDARFEEVTGR